MTDQQEFARLMAVLLTTLPGRESSPELIAAYSVALEDLTDAEFQSAVRLALKQCRWMPTPSELLTLARPGEDPGFLAGMALRQVIRVQNEARGTREYRTGARIITEVSPAAYQAFHAAGGAFALDDWDHPMHGPGIRKRFLECFERVAGMDRSQAQPMAGLPELSPDPRVRALLEGVGDGPRMSLRQPEVADG